MQSLPGRNVPNKRRLWALAALALAGPLIAAPEPAKPLTESDLLKTLEGFKSGDPLQKQPLSLESEGVRVRKATAADASTVAEPKKEEQSEKPVPTRGPTETEITAKEATFDQRNHQAVFLQEVVVINPEFRLTSDKLTAYLRRETPNPNAAAAGTSTAKPATPKPATPSAARPGASEGSGKASKGGAYKTGGLEKAIAEGNVVITQDKTDAQGNVTRNLGHARRAVYESATGDITLTGRPDVAQGMNVCVATDESTVITLNRDGHMKVSGPHKTIIKADAQSANAR
jgi:lipopolysaccharide export system protein LptA